MLDSALGPLGLAPEDLASGGPTITELFSGDRSGPAVRGQQGSQPTITVWSVGLASGVHILVGGWSAAAADGTVTFELTFSRVQPAGDDATLGVVAHRMQLPAVAGEPAADVLVISGSVNGVSADIRNGAGDPLGTVALTDGAAVVPTPAGAEVVLVTDDAGTVTRGLLSDTAYVDTESMGEVTVLTSIPGR